MMTENMENNMEQVMEDVVLQPNGGAKEVLIKVGKYTAFSAGTICLWEGGKYGYKKIKAWIKNRKAKKAKKEFKEPELQVPQGPDKTHPIEE